MKDDPRLGNGSAQEARELERLRQMDHIRCVPTKRPRDLNEVLEEIPMRREIRASELQETAGGRLDSFVKRPSDAGYAPDLDAEPALGMQLPAQTRRIARDSMAG